MKTRITLSLLIFITLFVVGCNKPFNQVTNSTSPKPTKQQTSNENNIITDTTKNTKMLPTPSKNVNKAKNYSAVEKNSQDVNKKKVTLYFGSILSEKLESENHNIDLSRNELEEKLIIQELLNGPINPNYLNLIPKKTKIINTHTKDGICYINFNKEFIKDTNTGSTGEMLIIYSIVYSLTELNHIDKVQFLVDGNSLDSYIHMDISEPIERNLHLFK